MKKNFFFVFLLFVFLTTYNYDKKELTHKGFFSIKEIEIIGIKNSNRNDLETKLSEIKKKNIIFLSLSDFSEIIKNTEFINSLEIKKIYPDKIKVGVIEDHPIGIFSNSNGEEVVLLENNKIAKNYKDKFKNLPKVFGNGAEKKFYDFYSKLQATDFDLKLIKQFNYYDINRWDLLLVDEKLIKLPPEGYEESILKFLEIYEKDNFKKFKLFDFRLKNELILK